MGKRYALITAVVGVGSLICPLIAQGQGRAGAAGASGATGGRAGRAGGGRGVVAAGQRTSGFPQYTRALPSEDVLARGKSLYDANCASCHAADLRGVIEKHGPNLLRSTDVYSDKDGELVSANLAKHNPVINLPQTDTSAIAGYLHSIQATMSNQGSPPGRNPVGLTYNVLVGNVNAGQVAFGKLCSNCHSITGDLKGIGTKYDDPKTLQNTWVSGGGGGGRGGGRGGGGGGQQATVTLANGQKVEGQLVRKDDFLVILMLPDGTRKSFVRDNLIPQVEVKDPQEAHKKMILVMDDPDNKNMHDITAYLATIK
jgi:cytochrome c oxidase cbb3-type subunit III